VGSIRNAAYLRDIRVAYGTDETNYINSLSDEMVAFRDKTESRELYETEAGIWSSLLSVAVKYEILDTLFDLERIIYESPG
jgi:hypothetical protein